MPKTKAKKILLADPDVKVVKELNKVLCEEGMEVVNVKDGTRALELALSIHPDLILMEIDLPYLNAVRVAQILKGNPKLKDTPILFMSSGKINPAYMSFFQNAVITKPFNIEEVINKVRGLLIKQEKSLEVQGDSKEVVGSLSQMSIVDLLQVFSMNKKDGVLVVRQEKNGMEGMVFLKEGEIINAVIGTAKGEKALYRLLCWEDGKFEYIPKNFNPEVSIEKTTDSLLMEGMRQIDEWKRMAPEFPSSDSLIYIKSAKAVSSTTLRPITKEVLALLEFYKKVGDIVDNCSHPDFEVMMTIHTLQAKSVIELRNDEKRDSRKDQPLLTSSEAFAIKEELRMAFRETREIETVKIPVLAENFADMKAVANILTGMRGFKLEAGLFLDEKVNEPFGPIGRVKASDNIILLFYAFPLSKIYAPLWSPLMVGAIGALISRSRLDSPAGVVASHLSSVMNLKSMVINIKKGLAVKDDPFYQTDIADIEKGKSENMLHSMLNLFLNLGKEKEGEA